MARYVLKISGENNKYIEAENLNKLLYIASYEYCDYYTVHDAGDIGDILDWDNGDDTAFTARIKRAVISLKQGYHVLFGDKTAKFKPNKLCTIKNVETIMKRAGASGFTIERV
jgi:hypothetical protein|nr:MAG TPA: hypothetical protein [Caudoviricetes sp.]